MPATKAVVAAAATKYTHKFETMDGVTSMGELARSDTSELYVVVVVDSTTSAEATSYEVLSSVLVESVLGQCQCSGFGFLPWHGGGPQILGPGQTPTESIQS
jgi:hypothetical protein